VIIAPESLIGLLPDGQVGSLRVTAWHSTDSTFLAIRSVLRSGNPVSRKADFIYNHLEAYLTNFTGRGELVAEASSRPDPANPNSVGTGGDGWLSLDDWGAIGDEQDRRYLQNRRNQMIQFGPEAFATTVGRIAVAAEAAATRRSPLDPMAEQYLASLVAMVRSAGAEPIFMVPAGGLTYRGAWLWQAQRLGVIPVLFDFSDPTAYPDLYRYDTWFDKEHLGEEASVLFSQYLADEVAGYLAALPGAAG
jgi:hypothetical protein